MTIFDTPKLTVPVNEQDHAEGPPDAPVTLVEYGDYECSHCGAAYPLLKDLRSRVGDRLRFVFRNFPLAKAHPHAMHAAEAAEAAAAQGKYWEMHDRLFEHQDELDDPHLAAHARAIGLNVERFNREMGEQIYAEHVRQDFRAGLRSGVNGTPTFFINGVRFNGNVDFEALLAAVEEALAGTAK